MTLIEVITAMAILAVVVVPTLRIFASTSGTNFRSRMRQRATTVGESVMESFKAYKMEDLCRQFDPSYPDTFKGVTADASTVLSMEVLDTAGNLIPVSDLFDDDDRLVKRAQQFNFKIENATSEGHYYDVEVIATERTAPKTVEIHNVDKTKDAVIELSEDMNAWAMSQLEQTAKTELENNFASLQPGATDHSVSGVTIKNLARTIDVAAGSNVTVSVSYTGDMTVAYSYSNSTTGASGTNSKTYTLSYDYEFTNDDGSVTTDKEVFNEVLAGGGVSPLRHIYLYYFPAYPSDFDCGEGASDTINISGTLGTASADSIQPHVVIAKQRATLLTDTTMNIVEPLYGATVTGPAVPLWTNLSTNFVATAPGAVSSISGFSEVKTIEEGIVEDVALLYDLEVHVYEAGTTNEVATYIGTKNE
ncbi:MAG: hypothetical protein NC091_02165 [Bacteroides sp.]|nr:hypothetical protein [Bacteroides sp.]